METIKKIFRFFKEKAEKVAGAVAATATMGAVTLSTFAATSDYVVVESTDLEPLLESARQNIGVVFPVAIGIFAIGFGLGFVPVIIKKFKSGV